MPVRNQVRNKHLGNDMLLAPSEKSGGACGSRRQLNERHHGSVKHHRRFIIGSIQRMYMGETAFYNDNGFNRLGFVCRAYHCPIG